MSSTHERRDGRPGAGRIAAATLSALATTATMAQVRGAESLEDMVVVATSGERALFETPYTAYHFDPDDLQLSLQPKSLPDSLASTPGVMVQKTGHGMTSPYLRGLTSQRTVLVADGIRVNNAILREGPNQYWNTLSPFFYDNVDILLGPASVLYGSDAAGGVVYARSTPLLRGEAGGDWQWHGGEGLLRYSSAEDSFSKYVEAAGAFSDSVSMRLGLTHQNFGDLHTGNDTRNPNTGFDQYGLNLRLRWWITDEDSILTGYDSFEQDDIDRVHKTIDAVPYAGTAPGTDTERTYGHRRQAAFVRYERRDPGSFVEEVDLGFSFQRMHEDYFADRLANKNRTEHRDTTDDTYALTLRAQSPSDYGTWTVSANYQHDKVDSNGHNIEAGVYVPLDQGQVADDAEYDLAGIALQNEYQATETVELITGIGYTHAHLHADTVNLNNNNKDGITGSLDGDWDAVTGSFRVSWRPLEDRNRLNLYAGISQAFRAPNMSDATRDDEFGGGAEAPTTNLDEERFTTFEVGAKTAGDNVRGAISLFHTEIRDRIARVKNSGVNTKRNLDQGHIDGVEAWGEWRFAADWTLFGTVAWQEGEEENYVGRELTNAEEELPMSRIAPLTGTAGLRWQHPDYGVWVESSVTAAARQDRLAEAEKTDNRFPPDGTPAYAVWTARAGYSLREDLDISVAVENITDTEYRIHGSGINEPGRNLVLSLRGRF